MDMINNVIKAMNGDQEAISKLYYVTYPKLRAVAVSILKNEDDAEDIVQDSYIKAFSSLHQLDNAKRFEPWLCRIVSNKCKDYLKKNKPVLFSTQDEVDDSEPIEWSIEDESKEYNPEEVLISSDTRKQIMELLDSLPDEQRICLVYYVVQDMKISEIAELLEVSESTVKSRINYAKSKMKAKINDLEKKGVKLRSFAGFALFPFIRHLFSSQTTSIPPFPTKIVSSASKIVTQSATTITEAPRSLSGVINTVKATVSQTIINMGIKAVSGILAVVVAITAATTIAIKVIDKEKTSTNDSSLAITESTNIIDNLSNQELADLNRYLSYLSEQRLRMYPCTDEEVYNFAYIYNKINTNNVFMDNGTVFDYAYCINKDIVDNTIKHFFNNSIGDISTEYVSLQKDIYYNIAADGQTYPFLSIAQQLYKVNDNTYRVIFDIYEVLNLNGSPIPDYYYALDATSADINSWMSRKIGGIAVITMDSSNNFYIKEYQETDEIARDINLSEDAKIISEGCSYYIARSKTYLKSGDTFPDPSGGDIYKDKYYEYHYKEYLGPDDPNDVNFTDEWQQWQWHGSQNGWGVRVLDDTLAEYYDIPTAIAGRPILNLDYTFAMCANLTKAPQIPLTITSMAYTFYGCEKMEEANITIPSGVKNIEATFMWCSSLKGKIEIKAIPEKYVMCFYRTAGPIILCGKERLDVYNSIIETAANNAVVWGSK